MERLLAAGALARSMQGHLPQQRRDPLLALARQQLPNRRRQIAHRGIQANAPGHKALRSRFSAIRRAASIYERRREWDIEVTFEETRAHLGVETQRQWSDAAIARTTPALFGVFSLLTLWAADPKITPNLRPRTAAWYHKNEPTFSDVIAVVRRRFWIAPNLSMSRQCPDSVEIPIDLWNRLTETLCFAA
jgi:hypothetical protein